MESPQARQHRLDYLREYYRKNRERLLLAQKNYNLLHPEVHLRASRKYTAKHHLSQTPEELNQTATWIGRRFELDALRILPEAKDMNSDKMNHQHFDLLWKGQKIDVKGKKLYLRKNKRKNLRPNRKLASCGQWTFHKGEGANLYLCLGYDYDGKTLLKAFLIPQEDYSKKGITVGILKSKFDKFQIPLPT